MEIINRIQELNIKQLEKRELLSLLCREVDETSRRLLLENSSELVISEFNRQTVLRMLKQDEMQETGSETVAVQDVMEMIDTLIAFLDKYMADQPQGHKWIILSCAFLSFIAGEPLHPQSIVHWEVDDEGRYHCPSAELQEGSLCLWCAGGAR